MAIKGKKKSQSRGSQARRKPAQAPRVIPSGRRHTPWWRTPGWASILGIIVVLSIGVVIWAVANARENAKDLEQRQEAVNDYTGQVRAVITKYSSAAAELSQVDPTKPADDLAKSAKDWSARFTSAQQELAGIVPPAELNAAHSIFQQSFALYQSTADTYVLVVALDVKQQNELLARGAATTAQATNIFQSAIEVLDAERDDVDLSPSGLLAPTSPPAQGPQSTPGG